MPLPPLSRFQTDLRAFTKKHVPPDYKGIFVIDADELEGTLEFTRRFAKLLAERDLLVPAWPPEYGGQNLPYIRQMELAEEMAYWYEPRGLYYMGIDLMGPTLIHHGTDAQKSQHLPPIAHAEVTWCQGFSEPNAGSDLASLKTAATRVKGGYRIAGQKIWTSYAHDADWCFVIARTSTEARKQQGITGFITPMRAAGISVRPIPASFGIHLNEVFFDDVFVPDENGVGEVGKGWEMVTAGLDIERIGHLWYPECQRIVDDLLPELSRLKGVTRQTARLRLAEISVSILAARYTCRRLYEAVDNGSLLSHESSAAKVYQAELYEKTTMTARSILGDLGFLHSSAGRVPLYGHTDRAIRFCKEPSIAGGPNEIQRNIIARWGLGRLPGS